MKPTEWTADRPPTRDEALLAAARALSVGDEWLPPDALHAQAHYAEAWIALAAAAGDVAAEPPAPTGPDWTDPSVLAMPPDAGVCRHGTQTLQGHNGRYHVTTLSMCYPDMP